jgi:hypothetical protein
MRILGKRILSSDNALSWICVGLALLAAIILDEDGLPNRQHAAIVWTVVALFGVLAFDRKKRNSGRFWLSG